MFLFSINKNGNKILHPDAVKLSPILATLTDDELLLVILTYDYYSPLRQQPESERMRRAQFQVFKNKKREPFSEPKIQEAIAEYCALQYDELREQADTYRAKIATINDAIRDSDISPSEIKRYVDTNKLLRDSVTKIEEELVMKEEQESITIQGKGQLSLIEKLMRNKEKYAEVIRKRNDTAAKKQEREAEEI